MYEDRRYAKAPVKEAIIHLQIEAALSIDRLSEGLLPNLLGYSASPIVDSKLTGRIRGGALQAEASQEPAGFILTKAEGNRKVQVRVDGFSFSWLAPYDRWEPFREEAKQIWSAYSAMAGSPKIVRLGLRYINQLDLPLPIRDLRDFVRTFPEVSSDLEQSLEGFFLQLRSPISDLDATMILNQTLVPPPRPDVAAMILDIDLFRNFNSGPSDEEVWRVLERFRVRKNMIFEGCITNRTREVIS